MILIPIIAVIVAVLIDLFLGDPRNRYHPTAWIGKLIAKLAPHCRSHNGQLEKIKGILLILCVISIVLTPILAFSYFVNSVSSTDQLVSRIFIAVLCIIAVGILLKTTIAIKGMEKHAWIIMQYIKKNDLEAARQNLSFIVKRNTKDLDKQHIISATLESLSENIVDGITGPLFYFSIFGLAGAFVYRTINTADSMIGYKTEIFQNLGWFGANSDKFVNFIPSRITSLIMILACMILGENWKHSYKIMRRDGSKTESPNAGYPMATLAGALDIKFEKIQHYVLGDGNEEISESHLKSAISIMKLTTALFVLLFVFPIVLLLSNLIWWMHV